ncbi:MAG: SRPBCC domain-containing protein [Gemmatimonadetes bacterium]|nr:SRPBCC domain-containing protein [Gemmatimonadota bacterium]
MPITSVTSDPHALTITVVADYPVPVERLWEAYADPRQLERFWGPVEWPATFTRHDMCVGGESHYRMTGPDGASSSGWFRFLKVEPHRLLEMEDGFSNEDGTPNDAMPTMRMVFNFEKVGKGSRFTSVTHFPNLESMEQVLKMGMEEGLRSAMSQIDAVLADLASFAASRATESKILNDTQVRISRIIRGTVADVWRAHHDAALMKRWMLGPDGWTMPVCEVARKVGDSYRYEWEKADGSQRFGFEGELLESDAPHRAVTTERMIGMEGPGTMNVLTLTPVTGGTLLTAVVTYPNRELRDMVLGTGMVGGMELSYARLEREVLGAPK